MNIREMIEQLENIRDDSELGDDMEVRTMSQQNWPFENNVHGVTSSKFLAEDDEEMVDSRNALARHEAGLETLDDDEFDRHTETVGAYEEAQEANVEVAYIVEGTQIGYGDKSAWDAC